MVHIVNGDLLKAKEDIIGHQVNCMGIMGSGVALQIKQKYSLALQEYTKVCTKNQSKPNKLLGDCQIVLVGCVEYVANLFGQETFGKDKNTIYTDYKALFKALKTLKIYAKKEGLSVALPYRIGCDRGNGDWDIVLTGIIDIFNDHEVTLYRKVM
jgi:O-acetyl-ADP-ribose deacetylase (regulator of RNase III)